MPRHDPGKPEALRGPRRALLDDCVGVLRRVVGVEVGQEPAVDPAADLALRVRRDGVEVEYAAKVQRHLRDAHVGPLAHRARGLEQRGQRLLVLADRIPDRLGAVLRRHGIAYLDRGGNAHLDAPGLYVLIEGRRPAPRGRTVRALRGTDVRLLGLFLADPTAGTAVQTDLAERAGIALGAVGDARTRLERLGLLERAGKRDWRVLDRAEALRRFGEGWATLVRHKLDPRTYRMLRLAGRGSIERRIQEARPQLACLLGGERAAAHLTRHLETDHVTLHVPPGRRKEAMEALGLVPDAGGTCILMDRYGAWDEQPARDPGDVPLAHPLLVWAECLTVPDERVAQAAALLFDDLQEGSDV